MLNGPAQRERVGFRAARGENHVAGLGPDRRGEALPRLFKDKPGGAALGVDRGRVPHDLHGRSHGVARLRTQRRGCIPVQIGPLRHGVRSFLVPGLYPEMPGHPKLLKHLLFVPSLVLKAPAATALARARD